MELGFCPRFEVVPERVCHYMFTSFKLRHTADRLESTMGMRICEVCHYRDFHRGRVTETPASAFLQSDLMWGYQVLSGRNRKW